MSNVKYRYFVVKDKELISRINQWFKNCDKYKRACDRLQRKLGVSGVFGEIGAIRGFSLDCKSLDEKNSLIENLGLYKNPSRYGYHQIARGKPGSKETRDAVAKINSICTTRVQEATFILTGKYKDSLTSFQMPYMVYPSFGLVNSEWVVSIGRLGNEDFVCPKGFVEIKPSEFVAMEEAEEEAKLSKANNGN